ncbi:MAG: DnaJ domain-containing protein [Acidobacteria bacterium]|nr:DnaJ domain-containing protein [Acidobacteriota bacterium]MBI3282301.1 DnaJ domain-containing protein [Acidobacteriota bacterium]
MPEEFIDYYEVLQISPNAEAETIQRVYRILAARFHPDNPATGDVDRFLALNKAYEVLSDGELRSAYDVDYELRRAQPLGVFELKEFASGIDGENNRRMGILCLLYNRRRTNVDSPGISLLQLETIMSLPREHLMFTIWYLREKGLVRQDEQSDYLITADGCDYVEGNLPSHRALYRLLKASELGRTDLSDAEAQELGDAKGGA